MIISIATARTTIMRPAFVLLTLSSTILTMNVAAIDVAGHKLMKPHILRETRNMFAYKGPNNVLGERGGISTVVQLGHTLLRHDLKEFTKGSLRAWLRGGLWPHVNHSGSYEEDIDEQCSLDMMQAEVEENLEAKLMLRRLARVRLYYWYKKQKRRIKDCRSPRNIWEWNLMRELKHTAFLSAFMRIGTRRMKKRKGPFVAHSSSIPRREEHRQEMMPASQILGRRDIGSSWK